MGLQDELKLYRPLQIHGHEGLLNIYFTASKMKKKADEFFRPFGLTDVQFNALALLHHQSDKVGTTQAQLSDMMLVNRANITSLIDRMEKADLVARTSDPKDRRNNIIRLTDKGVKLLDKVLPLYAKEVQRVMAPLSDSEQKKLIAMLEKVRAAITE